MKFKTPKFPKTRLLRPSSLAGGLDQAGTSSPNRDSDDDRFGGSERPSSMYLLAENWKKLEKSGKLRNWNFGGKIREGAKRASLRFSGRFSSGSPTPMNRKTPKPNVKARNLFGSHSDIEDDDDSFASTTTPLLLSSSMTNLAPPKPPRTFKTKLLDIGSDENECSVEDRGADQLCSVEDGELFPEGGNEFADVLAAIKKMGTIYSETEGEFQPTSNGVPSQNGNETKSEGIVANGKVTMGALVESTLEDEDVITPSTGVCILRDVQDSNEVDSSGKLPDSESSRPVQDSNEVDSNEKRPESESSRPIHRDETTGEVTGEPLVVSELDSAEGSSPTEADEKVTSQQTTSDVSDGIMEELEHKDVLTEMEEERPAKQSDVLEGGTQTSVTFRKRKVAAPAHQTLSPLWTCPIDGESDRLPGELRPYFDPKRMSILSCASTEWFSAESSSSSGDSKPNSASVSPEVPDSVSSPSQVEGGISPFLRFPSSDDECFSTPPCSPNAPISSNGEEGNYSAIPSPETTNETPEEGQVTSMPSMPELTGQVDENDIDQKSDMKEEVIPNCDTSDNVTSETAINQVADTPLGDVVQPDLPKKETSSPNRKRKRSLTVSSSIPLSRPSERPYSHRSLDDNFGIGLRRRHRTTDGTENQGLVSSFSEQDFADIFRSTVPVLKVDTVKEDSPEEGEQGASNAGSAVGLNDADNSSVGEEVEMIGTPNSVESKSRTSTPDNVEPAVIPDTTTPDMVSGHYDVTVVMGGFK